MGEKAVYIDNIVDYMSDTFIRNIFHNIEDEEVEEVEDETDAKNWNWMNGIMWKDEGDCKEWDCIKREDEDKQDVKIASESGAEEENDSLLDRFKTFIKDVEKNIFNGKTEEEPGEEKVNLRRWTNKWAGQGHDQDQEEEMVQADGFMYFLIALKNIQAYFERIFLC